MKKLEIAKKIDEGLLDNVG